jgi:hypothetical protein
MKAYHYFRKIGDTKDIKEYKKVIRPFHNIESLAILGIVSFFHPIFLAILIGYVAHIIMDIIDELRVFGSIENISIIMFLYKRSKQKAL